MKAPLPPEEFFLKFHIRERIHPKEARERRQELLVRLLQLVFLLLEDSGFEVMLSDGRGKLHKARHYLEVMLRYGPGERAEAELAREQEQEQE